jgi:hypothetical protein
VSHPTPGRGPGDRVRGATAAHHSHPDLRGQTYEVEPTSEGAHIRHAIEISGPLAGLMRLLRVDKVYQGWLDKEVAKLIAMAGDDPGSGDAGLPGRAL